MSITIEKLRAWSYGRQLLGKQGKSISEVMEQIIAIYSPHPTAALTLAARCADFSPSDFMELDKPGGAFRMPAMRQSIHILPRETASKIFAATVPTAESGHFEKRYSQDGRKIPTESFPAWRAELIDLLQTPMSAKELKGQSSIPDEKLKFVLNRMGYEGDLMRVGASSLTSNLLSYVATSHWASDDFVKQKVEASRTWLAKAYLKAFGPVRVKDFQWWAGIKAKEAKAAFAKLEVEEVGKNYFLLEEEKDDFEAFTSPLNQQIDILPQWDMYTMGYAPDGRERLVSPTFQDRLYGKIGATRGNAFGCVLIDGLVQAAWTSRINGKKMEVKIDWFEKASRSLEQEITARFEAISELLGVGKIELSPS